jgi:hypothetical protein
MKYYGFLWCGSTIIPWAIDFNKLETALRQKTFMKILTFLAQRRFLNDHNLSL